MMTIFTVDGVNYQVKGFGQEAANAITKEFPRSKIILAGFIIENKFIPSPWYSTK